MQRQFPTVGSHAHAIQKFASSVGILSGPYVFISFVNCNVNVTISNITSNSTQISLIAEARPTNMKVKDWCESTGGEMRHLASHLWSLYKKRRFVSKSEKVQILKVVNFKKRFLQATATTTSTSQKVQILKAVNFNKCALQATATTTTTTTTAETTTATTTSAFLQEPLAGHHS